MIPILSLVTTAFISPTLAVDWYAWTQANYAAIQHGLAQLNDAAKQMNNSIIQQQNRVEHGMDSIDSFVRQSLLATWSQYSNLKFSADQMQRMMSSIYKANRFKTYVSDTADGYKRSVTSNVMIPAQAIVQSILSAMTTIYDKQQKCSSYASQLVQPRTAIGRLQYCVLLAVPYFETVANTTLSLFDHGKNTVTTLIGLLGSCSPGSTSCVSKVGWNQLYLCCYFSNISFYASVYGRAARSVEQRGQCHFSFIRYSADCNEAGKISRPGMRVFDYRRHKTNCERTGP